MSDFNGLFLIGGLLLTLSILASRLSARMGMPLLPLFLGIGMLAGVDGIGGIDFQDYSQAYLIGQMALAMILLDGGLRTRMKTFRVGLRPALSLATLGVFITSGLTGLIAMWVFDLNLLQGLLVGAIVGSTDAAAVFSMLGRQGIHLNERVGATLEIESGTNDPMAIFLTLLLSELLTGTGRGLSDSLWLFISQFGVGLAVGLGGGLLLARLLKWLDLAPGLYSLLTAAMGFILFSVTNLLGGSGFLAIYLAGLMIGNTRGRHLEFILPVHDGLAWLSQIGLFLTLGLLVTPSEMIDYAAPGILVALTLIFVARPLAVLICLKPFFGFRWRELFFIAWVGLRGAVPIVLAIFPVIAGVTNASLYFNIAFFVVLISLMLQGTTLGPVARRLKVSLPPATAPARRQLLGILPEDDYEMFVYRIESQRVENTPLRMLRFPSGATMAALFRNHEMIHPKGSTRPQAKDVACVIGRTADLPALNRLFSGEAELKRERDFYGAFSLEGSAAMSDIADAYGLTLSPNERDNTLGEFISRRVGGNPVVGDDIDWHGIHWVVQEVEGNQVLRVGLRLHG
ncbi:potassium/proton antiporter [Kushneria phosphatilytica]|uniref:Potassium/proton antiporter n=1 Tax=Kushneria phosphatilytica TaxID=657387 RepID=A0A1S1NWR7_9GAMM|nr:potassium/proton antiporter [Kushneria phosphatilytica]OHV11898.1 K+/H+ antiporter [Kushneria phosphatilytica]QEL11073.1 potassium/proton antiporter [Kushneria phosphatilytica]